MQTTAIPVLAAAAIACANANATAIAQNDFIFDKLVDTQTPIPGGTSDFRFLWYTSTDQGTTAFMGMGSAGEWGVYAHDSRGLRVIADNYTASPGGGRFQAFVIPSFNNNRTAFFASTTDSDDGSIFLADGGNFQQVAGPNVTIPGRNDTFIHIFGLDLRGNALAFTGGTTTYRGAFLFDGAIHKLADVNSQVPESDANFTSFGSISTDGQNVLFRADLSNGQEGIYNADSQNLTRIIDSTDIMPGTSETFDWFGTPIADGDNVIVHGTSPSDHQGIYSVNDGQIELLADLNSPVPGQTGTFSSIVPWISADDGNVAFHAYFNNDNASGVFFLSDNQLYSVIATGDTLDGRIVDSAFLGDTRGTLDGNSLIVNINFTDGLSAIYLATIPSPATFLLLTAIPLTRRRRSH